MTSYSSLTGDVVAVFGVECASMDTFTDGELKVGDIASLYIYMILEGDSLFFWNVDAWTLVVHHKALLLLCHAHHSQNHILQLSY